MLRRLFGASIWAPGAISITEGEIARDVKRWVLPPIDLILIVGSLMAVFNGLPTFAVVYNAAVSHAASLAVLVFSVGCLVGVSFPRLWALELISKCGLAFVLITYGLLIVGRVLVGDSSGGFVGGISSALAVVPVWRIVWLGREYRRRKSRGTRGA
ncbi:MULTISPECIES: hypothetical protein [unclassified Microbacterium]|uniref:hypothetical protein n=1 Tax=unclassified Microbacterium TaxID=2609290 RepID=UPI00386DBB2B